MAPKKLDEATLKLLVKESLKISKTMDVTEEKIEWMLASHITKDKKKGIVPAASLSAIGEMRAPSQTEVKKFFKKIKDQLKILICTKEIQDFLKSGELSKALEKIIPAIIAALGIVAPGAALMTMIVWLAAYLIKIGIYDLCQWDPNA